MNRRDFIGILTKASVGAAISAPSSAQTATPERHGLDRLQDVIAGHDYTIFADMNHCDSDVLYSFLGQKTTGQMLRSAGARSVSLEVPDSVQPQIDAVQNRPVKHGAEAALVDRLFHHMNLTCPSDLNQSFMSFGLTFLAENIAPDTKLLAADDAKYLPDKSYLETFFRTRDAYSAELDQSGQQGSNTDASGETGAGLKAELMASEDAIATVRKGDAMNRAALNDIDQRSPPGYPRVIVYGAAHAEIMQKILQEQGHSVAIVAMHASGEAYREHLVLEPFKSFLDLKAADNFLVGEQRFADEPAPVRAPAARTQPRKVMHPR